MAVAARPVVSPDDQRVTFVELFFDLVFVFCVTQVVTLLHDGISLPAVGGALLVFWMVWWAWTQFTWALNAANTDHPRVQLGTLLATAVAFAMAVGIPGALEAAPLAFAAPYVVLRVLGLLLYVWVAWGDPAQRRAVHVFGTASVAGMIAVLAGAVAGEELLYWAWGLAIVLDVAAAGVGGQLEGWNLHPDHFSERHGLIVIIALGEALIVAAAGLSGVGVTPASVATGGLAVALTCALWWGYFRDAKPALEHALTACPDSLRARLARDAFSILHFPMLCGIAVLAAATEEALAHPQEPLEATGRAALAAGTVLFVGGTGASLWRATGRLRRTRAALTLAAAAIALTLESPPWVTLAVLFAGLVAIALIERAAADPDGAALS